MPALTFTFEFIFKGKSLTTVFVFFGNSSEYINDTFIVNHFMRSFWLIAPKTTTNKVRK